jgi:hypothetical protein
MNRVHDEERDLRELALVDRVLGLEAQLAQASAFMNPSRQRVVELENRIAGLEQQLGGLQDTPTWRAGRVVLTPARLLRRLRRR